MVDAIAASLKPLPAGVNKVNYGKTTAHKVLKVAQVIELVFLVLVIVLLAASTLLIANTIRLSIFSRRREIEVMKLVGATNWLVRRPVHARGADLRLPRRRDRDRPAPARAGVRAAHGAEPRPERGLRRARAARSA